MFLLSRGAGVSFSGGVLSTFVIVVKGGERESLHDDLLDVVDGCCHQ